MTNDINISINKGKLIVEVVEGGVGGGGGERTASKVHYSITSMISVLFSAVLRRGGF